MSNNLINNGPGRLAYQMLGSVSDAEDVLQEAHLKILQLGQKPEVEEAFLYRVVSNLCIDRLRRLKTERKYYTGPWLPDPVVSDSSQVTELAEELSFGFMLLLEKLTAAERIVYILNEGFDFSFPEIAEVLEISTASARQRASRARSKLAKSRDIGAKVKLDNSEQQQRLMLEAMMQKVAEHDVAGLVGLLADDAVAYTDGGGVVSAAIAPVQGASRIAQVMIHLNQKSQADGAPLIFEFAHLNGGLGLIVRQQDQVHSIVQIEMVNSLLQNLYVTRNPQKIAHLQSY